MTAWTACLRDLGQALLPARCLVCGERGAQGQDLCADCRAALPWNRIACPHCALPLTEASAACGACLQAPPPQSLTRAALRYGHPVDRLLPRFKFHADLAAGRLLSELMLEGLAGAERPQAVIPLPLHRSRLRQRGYDQALNWPGPSHPPWRCPWSRPCCGGSAIPHRSRNSMRGPAEATCRVPSSPRPRPCGMWPWWMTS